jgi:hypothetical protein
MPQGIVIPVDMDAPLQLREFTRLEDYQAAVGGYIEPIDLAELNSTLYLNEEGKPRGLTFNPRATFFWWFWQPTARNTDMLYGDAVLIGIPDEDGETTAVPTALSQVLLHDGKFKVMVKTFGDPKWYTNQLEIDDYFEAAVWGMMLLERWANAEKVRISPIPPIGTDPTVDGAS